jgi:hypothetical protein
MFGLTEIMIVLAMILATVLVCAWLNPKRTNKFRRAIGKPLIGLANIAEGTYEGKITKKTDAAITTRYLLAKIGTDAAHVDLCGVGDIPLGVITDEASAAEELVNVNLFGSQCQTQLGVASAAIAAGAFIVAAASGKVRTLPAAAGTYYIIGRALNAPGADGDICEFDPIPCVQRIVT